MSTDDLQKQIPLIDKSLQAAFVRRVRSGQDSETEGLIIDIFVTAAEKAGLAEGISPEKNQLFASVATELLKLLPDTSDKKAFPKTRRVLWASIIEHWLTSGDDTLERDLLEPIMHPGDLDETERHELREILRTSLDRHRREDFLERETFNKAVRLLAFTDEKTAGPTCDTVGRWIGYHSSSGQHAIVGSALKASPERFLGDADIKLAQPLLETAVKEVFQFVGWIMELSMSFEGKWPSRIEIHDLGSVAFGWEIGVKDDVSEANIEELSTAFLERAKNEVLRWRRELAEGPPAFSMRLVAVNKRPTLDPICHDKVFAVG